MDDSYKNGNIKIFELVDQTIAFKNTIDSSTFNIPEIQSIHSFSIVDDIMLVTLGNTGIGYINLRNYPVGVSLVRLND